MPETIACDLCGSASTRLLYRQKDFRFRTDETRWNVVHCRTCRLGYLNPRPTIDEIGRYYPRRYYGVRATAEERYRRQAQYVRRPAGRLLDIGTARGDFLVVMREQGWDVVGIEPFESAGNPHDLPIHRVPFPDGCSELDGTFDVITAWAVFEHLHRPADAFKVCEQLLRPGGQLIIQVPNLRSIQSRWALQEDVPRHLYFYTESTLREYGRRSGLTLEKVVHTTDLFGGSGRGALRLGLFRAAGRTVDDYFAMYAVPRRERFRRWPVMAPACTAVGLAERLILTDWLARTARVSGQIVAYFQKDGEHNRHGRSGNSNGG
jgi:SAM-dependent methyltransferase